MNTELLTRKPWLALSLLGLAYTVLGWHLSTHHIFWLVGTFVIGVTLIAAWKNNPILESLVWLGTQKLFAVVGITLLVSVIVALALTQPMLLNLIFLPLATLVYSELEMKAIGLKATDIFLCSVTTASLGLIIGEAIDLWIIPSMRY
ncbi:MULTISPECIES: hypothetical protein [Trichocoleus]|uniref:Uncharacterized protein n=1 Tax=Trichocoleus desertorum GB2-A4 TaxID=2933944 RepID=A0ABV0JCJ6_9CYAN|nr:MULTISPECIES: hypothetical protein [unclassified Trichocoleus]MBD1864015.1 hypothetical protein [Trichocoleus sp. FACHB-46]MBD2094039.1 hypothetical protein [Trichocoleus sp. FACHB-591]MBD2122232.1 hypothetical protein [Trichocoleus sp. FACHB-262]